MLSTGKRVWLLNVITQFFLPLKEDKAHIMTARNSMQGLDKANMM